MAASALTPVQVQCAKCVRKKEWLQTDCGKGPDEEDLILAEIAWRRETKNFINVSIFQVWTSNFESNSNSPLIFWWGNSWTYFIFLFRSNACYAFCSHLKSSPVIHGRLKIKSRDKQFSSLIFMMWILKAFDQTLWDLCLVFMTQKLLESNAL